jgi:hypothetical protein
LKITWPPGDLEEICASSKLLRQQFAADDAAVKQVLTVLHYSSSLKEVIKFKSFSLSFVSPTKKTDRDLLIRFKEIEVTATLLDNRGKPVRTDPRSPVQLDEIHQLRLNAIHRSA